MCRKMHCRSQGSTVRLGAGESQKIPGYNQGGQSCVSKAVYIMYIYTHGKLIRGKLGYLNTAVANGCSSLDTSDQSHCLAKQHGHAPLYAGLEGPLAHLLVLHAQQHCGQKQTCTFVRSAVSRIKWLQKLKPTCSKPRGAEHLTCVELRVMESWDKKHHQ